MAVDAIGLKNEKMNSKEKLGIVIFTCDKYADLWDAFFHFFNKFWPDCPYPIYLATNSKLVTYKNVAPLYSNQLSTWGKETLAAVSQYSLDYFIYFQEDYFLTQKVNNEELKLLFSKMLHLKADYLRLFPSPGADRKMTNEKDFGEISTTAKYRTSLQCSIWKTETFKTLLRPDESSWEFELNSPKRSFNFLFLSVFSQSKWKLKRTNYPINYYYMTAIYKGKWLKPPLNKCIKEGITPDLAYRKVESTWNYIYRKFYHISPLFARHFLDFLNTKIERK